jgi:hypothetical protein
MSSFLPIRVHLAPSSTRKVPKLLGDTVKRLVAVCEHRGLVHPYPPSYDGSGSSTALPPLPRRSAADGSASEDGGENEVRDESGGESSVGDGGENEAGGESEAGEENEAGEESEAGSGESEVDAGENEADDAVADEAIVVGKRAGTRAGTRAQEQLKRGRG